MPRIFLVVFLFPAFVLAAAPPPGWKAMSPLEVWPNSNQEWRARYPDNAWSVDGDFDGDGTADHVQMLASENRRHLGLFAWLSSEGAPRRLTDLETFDYDTRITGIERVPPGEYRYLCPGATILRPCWITFRLPSGGIALFRSQDDRPTIYYWNAYQKKFMTRAIP